MIKVTMMTLDKHSVIDKREYRDEVDYAEDILDKCAWAEIQGHKVENVKLDDNHEHFDIPDYNVRIDVVRE